MSTTTRREGGKQREKRLGKKKGGWSEKENWQRGKEIMA